MKYVVVDDNEVDRLLIETYAHAHPELQMKGSFEHPLEAIEAVNQHPPDLLFLDIEMPMMNGVDFLRSLHQPPLCIFITSHPEFALEAFELYALDYVLKPITEARFNATVQRAKNFFEIRQNALEYKHQIEQDSIVIQEGYDTHRIHLADILYLEALKDYTCIYTTQRRYVTLGNISRTIENLNQPVFTRVHRSYAINSRHIDSIMDNKIRILETEIPIGKTYRNIVNALRKQS